MLFSHKDKKRVLLFNPIAYPFSEDELLKRSVSSASGAPLSALAVASILNKKGYRVKIICGSEKDYLNKVISWLDNKPVLVGISSMTGYQIKQGLLVAKTIREHKPEIPLVWGGYHPSIVPEKTIQSSYVDYVIRGYGEEAVYELAEALTGNIPLASIKGLTYLEKGEIKNNDERPIKDINSFPQLPYHLINVPEFLSYEFGAKTIAYISSRGCPNNCSFCADMMVYKRKWNALSAKRVIDDLAYLKNQYQIDSLRIMDSNFFIDEKRVREICEGIIEKNLNLKWGRMNGSAEILARYQDSTWELMAKAGCFSLAIGVESGYKIALEKINKKADLSDIERLKEIALKYDIKLLYAFMLGIPIEYHNKELKREHLLNEIEGTLNLLNRLMKNRRGLDRPVFFRFTIYPGCSVYKDILDMGWKEPQTLEEWSNHDLFSAEMPWLSKSETDLIDSIREMVHLAYPPISFGSK